MRIDRPWGHMYKIIHLPFFWVKWINVKTRTSLQYHYYRYELHISIKGVVLIKPRANHRLLEGKYLEIAWGKVVSEKDIIRLVDDYGRT